MKYNNIRVKSAIAASTDISCFSWDGTLGWNIIIFIKHTEENKCIISVSVTFPFHILIWYY